MINVLNAGRVPYEAAAPLKKPSASETGRLVLGFLIDILRILILTVPILIKSLVNLCLPTPRKSIKGQVALVTGGGNGLGRAIVLRLAGQGCHIAIVDIDGAAARKVAEEAKGFGVKAVGYEVDVSDHEKINKLKTQVEEDIGPVEILINNAAIVPRLSLHNGPAEHIARIVEVNLNSNIWTIRTFLPDMKKRQRGHIVSIASMTVQFQLVGAITYGATKAAVAALMRGVEQEIRMEELADYVKTSCVFPFFIATRRDLCEAADLRLPPISPNYCADKIVDGILADEREIYVPRYLYYFLKILDILPFETENLVRDYIVKEKEMAKFDFLSADSDNKTIDRNKNVIDSKQVNT